MDPLSYYLAKENNSKDKIIQLLKKSIQHQEEQLRIITRENHDLRRRYLDQRDATRLAYDELFELRQFYDAAIRNEILPIRRRLNYDTDEEVENLREQARENRYNSD